MAVRTNGSHGGVIGFKYNMSFILISGRKQYRIVSYLNCIGISYRSVKHHIAGPFAWSEVRSHGIIGLCSFPFYSSCVPFCCSGSSGGADNIGAAVAVHGRSRGIKKYFLVCQQFARCLDRNGVSIISSATVFIA